jgi:hypothetical protein
MLITDNGRVVIACSHCPIRLDLGPKPAVEHRNRMPSMWRNLGDDRHACPNCAPVYGPRFSRSPSGALLVS